MPKTPSQMIPDEDVTITAQADGYEARSTTLRLAEGATRDVELILSRKVSVSPK